MLSLLDVQDSRHAHMLASLLGLTPDELNLLHHKGLQEKKDIHGKVLFYYVVVSRHNPQYLLEKLKLSEGSQVIFTLEQVIRELSSSFPDR